MSDKIEGKIEWGERGDGADGETACDAKVVGARRSGIEVEEGSLLFTRCLGGELEGENGTADFEVSEADGFAGFCDEKVRERLGLCMERVGDGVEAGGSEMSGFAPCDFEGIEGRLGSLIQGRRVAQGNFCEKGAGGGIVNGKRGGGGKPAGSDAEARGVKAVGQRMIHAWKVASGAARITSGPFARLFSPLLLWFLQVSLITTFIRLCVGMPLGGPWNLQLARVRWAYRSSGLRITIRCRSVLMTGGCCVRKCLRM